MAGARDISLRVDGTSSFVAVSRALKAAGQGEMRKAMFKEIRAIAKPVQADMRNSIEHVGTKAKRDAWRRKGNASVARARARLGDDHSKWTERKMKTAVRGSGLRATISRGIKVIVKDSGYAGQIGVRIVSDTSGLPAEEKRLPRYMDDSRGWRHPFMGNRNLWVHQYATPSRWFTGTAQRELPAARSRIQQAVVEYAQRLARNASH